MTSQLVTAARYGSDQPPADRQVAADLLARLLTDAQRPLDGLADNWRKLVLLTIRTDHVAPGEAIAHLLPAAAAARELSSRIMAAVSALSRIEAEDICWEAEQPPPETKPPVEAG